MRCRSSETLEAGSRHDLRLGSRPAPRMTVTSAMRPTGHSAMCIPTRRRPATMVRALRFVLFVSGCPLRCSYCHNPDSWHLKDGTYIPAQQVIDRLAGFASALARAGRGADHLGRRTFGPDRLSPGASCLPPRRWAFTPRLRPRAILAIAWTTTICQRSTSSCSTSRVQTRTPIARLPAATWLQAAFRGTARCHGQARLGAVYAGAGAHGRAGQCRWHCTVRRSHEKCRVGGGAALPSARRLQVEGAQSRLQARRYATAHS